MKKDTLIKGTIILALAALIARALGLLQRVPLQYYLDDYGMALYGIAYNIYFALLIVATAGIPSALSKLVADRLALGHEAEARLIYRAAVRFAIVAGVLITLVLYVFAPFYATHIAHVPESAMAIRALAPAMLLFPLIAIMRGYFQGRQNMTAGGVSQIIEQIMRVATAVLLVGLLITAGYSLEKAAAGASFGGVLGSIGAFAVMIYFWLKLRRSQDTPVVQEPAKKLRLRSIYAQIFRLSVPISIISIIVPAIYFIDSSIVVPLIKEQVLGGTREAQELLGILVGRAQSFAGIPPILAIAVSTSIVPIISAAFARKDNQQLSSQASMALRLSMLAGLPIVIMLVAAARSYNQFLFGDTNGTWIIVALTATAMFQILMMTSAAVLMGLGMTRGPMLFVAIGIAVKLLASWLFAGWWGIYGIVAATALAFTLIMLLNLMQLRKHIHFVILGRRWLPLVIVGLILTATGFGLDSLAFELRWSAWLTALLSSTLLAVLYPILLAVSGVLRKSDLPLLPARVQKLMEKLGLQKWLRG